MAELSQKEKDFLAESQKTAEKFKMSDKYAAKAKLQMAEKAKKDEAKKAEKK